MSKYQVVGDKVICGKLEIPVVFDGDVVVAGGGPGGLGAAMIAGKRGYKTILVEKYGYLGGMGSYGNGMPLGGAYPGYKTIGGIAEEVFERLRNSGQDSAWEVDERNFSVRFYPDSNHFKYLCADMVQNYGTKILLDSFVSDAIMDGTRVAGIIVVNKSGYQAILGKTIIDATGDADVVYKAGGEFEIGLESDGTFMAVNIAYILADVDVPRLKEYTKEDPLFKKAFARAKEEDGYEPAPGDKSYWLHDYFRPNTMFCNNVRVQNVDATDVEQLTYAEIENRRRIVNNINFYRKYIPGLENCYASSVGELGIRDTRRIIGEDRLTVDACLKQEKHPDNILRCCGPIDNASRGNAGSHIVPMDNQKDWYDIPYGCIVPKGLDNILISGRSFSSEALAQSGSRGIGLLIGMGEAAGTAAGLMVDHGVKAKDVNVKELQALMRENGCDLG